MDFNKFFKECCGHAPHPYQNTLATDDWPETLIIPTGFGKTAAVLAAWIWKIGQCKDPATPRRLVYCLPMRSLVEQTEEVAKNWITEAKETLGVEITLDVLMGGRRQGRRGLPDWMLRPECPAILIGTQDMLVSAALMRGYGTSRYRWPVDFALLHNDALWVFDEVQLTGATLPTSAQLEAFRGKLRLTRPSRTLWMSATLDPKWLKTVDFTPKDTSRPHDLGEEDIAKTGHLWTARKQLVQLDLGCSDIGKGKGLKSYAKELAKCAVERAKPHTNTIIFLNTVARAQAVFSYIKDSGFAGERLLIHSRFRGQERAGLMKRLQTEAPEQGCIIVATQALEAGVDVTSTTMMTEIAPWSSLVQRFGRCNRYGEETGAKIFWIDLPEAAMRPYTAEDGETARQKLKKLSDCGPQSLAEIPLPAPQQHNVIRQRDLLDLFDTDPDLSGFDVDISLYIRDADDTDVRVFWRKVDTDGPTPEEVAPSSMELCPAPIGDAKKLLNRKDVRAWVWDALRKEWCPVKEDDIFAGMTLMLDATCGGYDPEKGFDPTEKEYVEPVPTAPDQDTEQAFDNDEPSGVRVSLAKHSLHVRDEAAHLAQQFELDKNERDILIKAALWHDLGKAHDVFKARCGLEQDATPLAKTRDYKWWREDTGNRRYFRHELASSLAYLAHHGWTREADLPAYLIAAHHGKVRMRIRALPDETREGAGLFARGVWDGDEISQTDLGEAVAPKTKLNLDLMQLGEGPLGASWSARCQALLKEYGPFRLAFLESLLRIADWRASKAEDEAGHDDL